MSFIDLRQQYHRDICEHILHIIDGVPNIADRSSKASINISRAIVDQLDATGIEVLTGQRKGKQFEAITKDFLEQSFTLLQHIRPGQWLFSTSGSITQFEQYKHLAYIQEILSANPELTAALGGDYLVTPDIVIGKYPLEDHEINIQGEFINESDSICQYTPLRAKNTAYPTLHASISCKWTLRSDRSQNARTEALNLIRNRKGNTPRIVAITAEPLPTRLASLALGTGDLDCVYHFALHELIAGVEATNNDDQMDMLMTLINGKRLCDVSDLPLDLII